MKSFLSLFLILAALGTQAQITSTFDTDADGWTFTSVSTSIPITHQPSGGNPTGYVSVTYSSNASTTVQNWIAPAKFHGNHLVKSLGMLLKFDLQQSQAGTGAGYDVLIRNGGAFIYISGITPKPAVAPTWTSYSFTLDETGGWFYSAGAVPATRSNIKSILSNVTSIEIRGTYATNAAYTSGLDNVILEQRSILSAPTASSLSISSGKPGSVITINGSGFATTPSANSVSFGALASTKAVVQSATTNQLQVVIPAGASYGPITITNTVTGLSSKTTTPFNPVFDGGGRIVPASYKSKFTISTIGIEGMFVGDFDGDGWEDFAVANNNADDVIDIYRNLGLGGDLLDTSFDTKVSFSIPQLGGSGTNGAGLWFADLDGDGLLDAVSSNSTTAINSAFITLRNISTPGNLAFEAPEYWAGASDETPINLITDLDGDGRPELIAGEGSGGSTSSTFFWANQNISIPGNIEFGGPVFPLSAAVPNGFAGATAGDLNGDGNNELIISSNFGDRFTVLENKSVPGNPSFLNAFTIVTGQYNRSMKVADVNLDGKNDLVWKKSGGGVYIRINNDTDGILTDTDFIEEYILTSDLGADGGIAITDFNGDGKPDIALTDSDAVGVFENIFNSGAFSIDAYIPAFQVFGANAGSNTSSPLVSDFNHDGKPDFLIGGSASITIVENKNVEAPYISVNTVSPLSAPVGSTVTITGNNFSTVLTDNEVWFGDVRALVLTATTTQLTVTVPSGAAYAPVSVRRGEFSSNYHLPFATSFSAGVTFNNTHFAAPVTYALTGADYDIEVGDLDLDGKPDIVAEGSGLISRLFRNTHTSGAISSSSLAVPSVTSNSSGNSKLVDVDGDGRLDIVSTNGRTYPNQSTLGNVTFGTEITTASSNEVNYGDLNKDGKMDLVHAAPTSASSQMYLQENRSNAGQFVNNGTYGTFNNNIVYGKASRGGDVTIADFDNDGFNDVVSLNPFTDNMSIFRNTQKYRVSTSLLAAQADVAVGDNPLRSYPADFDRDGKIDLLVTHWTGTTTTLLIVFHNTSTVGNISFNRVDLTNPSATTVATVADLDGDGKPEILTTSETGNRFSIFKNIHTSGALTAASFAAPFNTTVTAPRGITTGDLNLDGKPEIIITRAAGLLVVYENLIASVDSFITQWNLATAGSGAAQLSFGTATSGVVNYTWQQLPSGASGSGSWNGSTLTITGLPAGATIRLQIAPANFQRIIINTGADRNRLTQVEQWGGTAWTSMQNAFSGCANLQVTATDVPDLSGVTTMSGMFRFCTTLNSPSNIGSWNTSVVTDMSALFSQASAFNQNISTWNTGAVLNMSNLFADAAAFNQDIGAWNTATVTNMGSMFAGALVFNRSIAAWNTAAVTNMAAMFFSAYVFNQNISTWNTAAVTNMNSMFGYARDFNQNIGSWNTSAVTNMSRMFEDAFDFNQNIGVWNTSAVTNMRGMFIDAYAFNQNIGTWNTSAVTDMSRMFDFATAFNQNIGAWNTTAVTDMSGMFADASAFNQNIGTWALNPAVNLSNMLNNSGMDCNNYSATLIGWSANPSTPNSRALGATGRQYGTNAVAAKTNLTSTKLWTITGDTPSGTACNLVSVPTITSFTPASGAVGTIVTITGTNFSTTPANNIVAFNGTTAVVTASTATSITTTVPTGATTGKITVTVAGSTATSATDFTVTTITNQPPVIASTTGAALIGGIITIDLLPLLSDPDNNLDLSTLQLISSTSTQGASASINGANQLVLNYGGILFSGTDNVEISVCDVLGECATQTLSITVSGEIEIFNAISPNGDDKNEIFRIANIDLLEPENTVTIYNRWGSKVFEAENYSEANAFRGLNQNGNELPSGTYYYKILIKSTGKTQTGFLALKR